VVQDIDPGTRVEAREKEHGTEGGPVKLAWTPDAGRKREDGGHNPAEDAEFVAAYAAQ
jgi:hypothetical protein